MGKTCSKCNHENGEGAIYCENCNEQLSIFGSSARKNDAPPPPQEEVYEAPPAQPVEKPKKGGCLKIGCALALICLLLVVCAIGGAYYYVDSQLDQFLVTTPIEITPRKTLPSEIEKIQQKMDAFANGETKTLSLSDLELNALCSEEPELKNNLYFHINRDLLRIKGNIPVPLFNKYLSGRVDIIAKTVNGKNVVNIVRISPEKGAISADALKELKSLNLIDFAKKEAGVLDEIKSINIANGKLTITKK